MVELIIAHGFVLVKIKFMIANFVFIMALLYARKYIIRGFLHTSHIWCISVCALSYYVQNVNVMNARAKKVKTA